MWSHFQNREMYEEQVNMFTSWLHDIESNVTEIYEVDQANIDTVLQKLYSFEAEHSEKKPIVKSICEKFNAALRGDVSVENPLVAQYDNSIKKYEVMDRENIYVIRSDDKL